LEVCGEAEIGGRPEADGWLECSGVFLLRTGVLINIKEIATLSSSRYSGLTWMSSEFSSRYPLEMAMALIAWFTLAVPVARSVGDSPVLVVWAIDPATLFTLEVEDTLRSRDWKTLPPLTMLTVEVGMTEVEG
jgi:hypothetical protein